MQKLWIKLVARREVILYLFFGVMTTVVNFIVYTITTRLMAVDVIAASVIAWVIAVIFAYITNKFFVFESKNLRGDLLIKEITAFTLARLFSLGIDIAIMYVGVKMLFIFDIYVKIVSQIVVVLMNYILSKFLIFKKEDKNA
ncbi:hypothetical protein SDC9_135617 [bioreactor metagenome]|uniref:GtrA/DPMS transmembrane domain-containing protein n=1 Tax=bioreactor metagenome TaxID=1076179 RepID=A0A645DI69_9ZZZZ|nr:GtrA family protein [Erysipelotrichaceae bacterium]